MCSVNIIENIKKEVDSLLAGDEVEKAFSLLLTVLYLSPQCLQYVQDTFVNSLCIIGQKEEKNNNLIKLFKLYKEGIKHYPNDPIIYSNLGAHLFRLGYIDEARSYFEKALALDAEYLPAHSNLHNIYNLLIPRWHYAMLNDQKRNQSFEAAIAEAIKDGYDSVLDIGTGTGLLSMYAVEHGASQVYACDYSSTMIDIATQVIQDNKMADKIKLIPKLSHDIQIPEDIPHKVALVVTETVDAGGTGEHILQTVRHALQNLLLPAGLVIPSRLKLFAQVVECEHIRAKYKFQATIPRETNHESEGATENPTEMKENNAPKSHNPLKHCKKITSTTQSIHRNGENETSVPDTECQTVGSVENCRKPTVGEVDETNVEIPVEFNSRCCIDQPNATTGHRNENNSSSMYVKISKEQQTSTDSNFEEHHTSMGPAPSFEFHAQKQLNAHYDCENFAHIPHKALSLPVEVISVDLNCLEDVEQVLLGITKKFLLNCTTTGTADAVIAWFELELYKNISLSSSVESNSSWDQAVFPVFNNIAITNEHITSRDDSNCDEEINSCSDSKSININDPKKYSINGNSCEDFNTDSGDETIMNHSRKKSEYCRKNEKFRASVDSKASCVFLNLSCKDGFIKIDLAIETSDETGGEIKMFEEQSTDETVKKSHTSESSEILSSPTITSHNCPKTSIGNDCSESSSSQISSNKKNLSKLKSRKSHFIVSKSDIKTSSIVNQDALIFSVTSDVVQACQLIRPHLDLMLGNIVERVGSVNNILDLSAFPLLGIECLKTFPESKLFYLLDEDTDAVLTSCLTSLHIDPVRYYCLTRADLTPDLQKHLKFDVVLADLQDSRGDFCSLQLMSPILSCLSDKGLILPRRIDIYCQLIHSDCLDRQGHMLAVGDKYRIAPIINQYQVSQHPDLDMWCLPHTPLSPPTLLASLPSPQLPHSSTQPLPPLSPGLINGLVYWMSPGPGWGGPRGVFYVNPGVPCEPSTPVSVHLSYEPGYFRLALV